MRRREVTLYQPPDLSMTSIMLKTPYDLKALNIGPNTCQTENNDHSHSSRKVPGENNLKYAKCANFYSSVSCWLKCANQDILFCEYRTKRCMAWGCMICTSFPCNYRLVMKTFLFALKVSAWLSLVSLPHNILKAPAKSPEIETLEHWGLGSLLGP